MAEVNIENCESYEQLRTAQQVLKILTIVIDISLENIVLKSLFHPSSLNCPRCRNKKSFRVCSAPAEGLEELGGSF